MARLYGATGDDIVRLDEEAEAWAVVATHRTGLAA
jgi:hypothetical protein